MPHHIKNAETVRDYARSVADDFEAVAKAVERGVDWTNRPSLDKTRPVPAWITRGEVLAAAKSIRTAAEVVIERLSFEAEAERDIERLTA